MTNAQTGEDPNEHLPAELPDGPDSPRGSVTRTRSLRAETYHVGPWPDPQYMAEYAQIRPDLVDEIVAGAASERQHRHDMDRRRHRRSSWGLAAGFLVAIFALGVAGFVAYHGHAWLAGVIASLDLAALVAVFVYGSHNGRTERNVLPSEPNA